MSRRDISMANLQTMCPKLSNITVETGRQGQEILTGWNIRNEKVIQAHAPRVSDRVVKTFFHEYSKAETAGLL